MWSRPGQVQGYRRVDGPSDEEVAEKKKKMREVSELMLRINLQSFIVIQC